MYIRLRALQFFALLLEPHSHATPPEASGRLGRTRGAAFAWSLTFSNECQVISGGVALLTCARTLDRSLHVRLCVLDTI